MGEFGVRRPSGVSIHSFGKNEMVVGSWVLRGMYDYEFAIKVATFWKVIFPVWKFFPHCCPLLPALVRNVAHKFSTGWNRKYWSKCNREHWSSVEPGTFQTVDGHHR